MKCANAFFATGIGVDFSPYGFGTAKAAGYGGGRDGDNGLWQSRERRMVHIERKGTK